MSDKWFRLPETGDGSTDNPYRPDFFGYTIDGYTGNETHPDGAPNWVVRVYADSNTLDSLASEAGVQELSNVPVQALNNMFGQDRDANGWENGFSVGTQ